MLNPSRNVYSAILSQRGFQLKNPFGHLINFEIPLYLCFYTSPFSGLSPFVHPLTRSTAFRKPLVWVTPWPLALLPGTFLLCSSPCLFCPTLLLLRKILSLSGGESRGSRFLAGKGKARPKANYQPHRKCTHSFVSPTHTLAYLSF